mmetsp:Transcript_32323/g.62144  ORF Transcript_32323/g.62144 Transcript_32323/m.62144 type:complete len:655 (+) Transcript_32323:114-2078(+)
MPGVVLAETKCIRGCCTSTECNLQVKMADLALQDGAIAKGASSKVFQGFYNKEAVAIKVPSLPRSDDLDRFHKELQMMMRLDHPNVVKLLAAKAHPPDYFFVLPLSERNVAQAVHEQAWRPSWNKIVRLGLGISAGLAHLHHLDVVHRDLKPANILLDGEHVRITDLGISEYEEVLKTSVEENGNIRWRPRGKPSGGFHKQIMAGTLEYMAPEVLQKQPSSKAADVFAFAVVLNEIATGIVPYSDCTKDNPGCHTVLEMGYGRQELAAAVAGDGLRPILAEDTPPELLSLLERCWRLDPAARPSVDEIHAELAVIAESLGPEKPPAARLDHAPCAMDLDAGVGGEGGLTGAGPSVELTAPAWGSPSRRFPLKVRLAPFATAGRRGADRMEDRHLVLQNLGGIQDAHLMAVFDGHRGASAAEYCADFLPHHLAEAWSSAPNMGAAMCAAFESADKAFCAAERREKQNAADSGLRVDSTYAGCTAIAALLYGTTLVVANSGDCRGLLCTAGQAVQITRDHSAECEEERQRIIDAGGKVELKDSWRIGKAGIQVTRSIGDQDAKADGLTPTPEVYVRELSPEDEFLVFACDGLWDTLSNDQVVGIIKDTVKHPAMVAQRLGTEAINAGSGDNITVIVVFLQPSVGTLEQIYSETYNG